jgi:F0F1-type ATP synthase membrane subunit c/vacuolar-type H+-ATPase subunit K
MELTVAKVFAGALALLPLLGVGMGLGKLFASFVESVGRNPSAKKDIFQVGMIGAAMTEAIAIFSLVVAMIILFVIN